MEKLDIHTYFKARRGYILEYHMMAAAGFGNPLERDIEEVREDVRNELISVEKAKKDYGVIIDPETLEVDFKATEELRKKGIGSRIRL